MIIYPLSFSCVFDTTPVLYPYRKITSVSLVMTYYGVNIIYVCIVATTCKQVTPTNPMHTLCCVCVCVYFHDAYYYSYFSWSTNTRPTVTWILGGVLCTEYRSVGIRPLLR